MCKNILVLVNKYTTVINFRLELVDALVKEGYNVFVSVPYHERVKEIEAIGATIIDTNFDKDSINPIADLKLIHNYYKLIKKLKIDVVLTFTIKPNIYGGIAASLCNVPYFANITGLGKALETQGFLQKIAIMLYKISFRKISGLFFQNYQNKLFFEQNKICSATSYLLPGSGVNLERFSPLVYPSADIVEFAFISRIMKEKGIEYYVELARKVKQEYPNTKFHVAGFGNDYYENMMAALHKEGIIEYHGLLSDTRVLLKQVHCVIHPTYYPEGMSNVLLESAASARPIISTNRFGCKETIDHGKNGYLVNEQDFNDLYFKVIDFLSLSYEEKKSMGINGRKKVQEQFDRNIIINKYLEVIGKIR